MSGRPHAQNWVTKRFVREEGSSPAAIVTGWSTFISRIAYFSLEDDQSATEWGPCDPQLSFTSDTLPQKVQMFVELLPESCLWPIIKTKIGHKEDLPQVFEETEARH